MDAANLIPTPYLEQILAQSRARSTGRDKWTGHCLNQANHRHGDRHGSLSIYLTSSGVILLHCFSGCSQADVIASLGLHPKNLFPSTAPLSRAELRAIEAKRRKRERLAVLRRDAERHAGRQLYKLTKAASEVGAELAVTADNDPRGERLAEIFHAVLAKLRKVEAHLAQIRVSK